MKEKAFSWFSPVFIIWSKISMVTTEQAFCISRLLYFSKYDEIALSILVKTVFVTFFRKLIFKANATKII